MSAMIQYVLYLAILVVLAIPLGAYIKNVMNGEKTFLSKVLTPCENLIYKVMRVDREEQMTWKKYAVSVLTFSGVGLVFLFLLQLVQGVLPGNPQHLSGVKWDLAFNTSASFITNTNWQAYSGESTLDAGADDYLTKPFSVEELLARLRVTQRRLSLMTAEMFTASSVFVNGKLKVDYAGGCAYLDENELHLTPIEYKLLCLLSKNVGKVLTHTFITQNIWGRSWDNDVASLRVFMATLRKKLEPTEESPQYIQTHIGVGYRMIKVE